MDIVILLLLGNILLTADINKKVIDPTLFLIYVNWLVRVCYFCILLLVVKNILEITYRQKHPDYTRYYKIISKSWNIWDLIKLLCRFI